MNANFLAEMNTLESRRMLSAGAIDPYFGAKGVTAVATIPLLEDNQHIHSSLAVAPDGNIFAAYYQTTGGGTIGVPFVRTLHVRKFTASGIADPRFNGGEVLVPGHRGAEHSGSLAFAESIAPLADGSVLVAADNGIYKFRFNGKLDKTFGDAGRINTGELIVQDIGVQNDGSILVTGGSGFFATYVIARLHADGSPDLNFGTASRRQIPIGAVATASESADGESSFGQSITITPDGSAYVSGTYDVLVTFNDGEPTPGVGHDTGLLIERINPDGTFDSRFDGDGMARFGTGPQPDATLEDVRINGSLEIIKSDALDAADNLQLLTTGGSGSLLLRITPEGQEIRDPAPPNVDANIVGPVIWQSDGRAIGADATLPRDGTFSPVRITTAGTRDTTFTGAPIAYYQFSTPAFALAKDGSPLVFSANQLKSGGIAFTLRRLWRGNGPMTEGTAPAITSASAAPEFITITYRDDQKLDLASLGNRDLRITGPNGFVAYAKFNRLLENQNAGGFLRARYSLTAPGGSWDAADNGVYTVRLRAGEVLDSTGNSADARAVATITVSI